MDAITVIERDLEVAAQSSGTPSERRARVRAIRTRLVDVLGAADTYLGDIGLEEEAQTLARVSGELDARAGADVREEMEAKGVSGEDLDAIGAPSHDSIDKHAQESEGP